VTPPTTTIAKTSAQHISNQAATGRRIASRRAALREGLLSAQGAANK
jgi:hypothetical protein